MDQGFPHISYDKGLSYKQWGHHHGESFAGAIVELAAIRRDLMLAKSPHLKNVLDDYAGHQLEITKNFHIGLYDELKAISESSGATLTDLVILNNYTDFRDIQLVDEGCTTIALHQKHNYCAQTWDMHSSAKDYLATIELPNGSTILSLVGCLGMMGINSKQLFVGVNNLNTSDAVNGLLWPALVRSLLEKKTYQELQDELASAPVTSGHNYLISDGKHSIHIEVSPSGQAIASELKEVGVIYHTNHCLTDYGKEVQDQISVNSTTFERYNYCEKRADQLINSTDLYNFLTSHDGYPKSICSHFQSGALDPSTTCGGALYDFHKREFTAWRGCPHEDNNFIKKSFTKSQS